LAIAQLLVAEGYTRRVITGRHAVEGKETVKLSQDFGVEVQFVPAEMARNENAVELADQGAPRLDSITA
jgi:hypothetical protein